MRLPAKKIPVATPVVTTDRRIRMLMDIALQPLPKFLILSVAFTLDLVRLLMNVTGEDLGEVNFEPLLLTKDLSIISFQI